MVFCWLISGTFRLRDMFAKLRNCSSSPCSSSIFCSNRKTKSFGAGVLRLSEVSAFSFRIPLKSSILAFFLLFVLLGGGGGGGPLDLVRYANDASMCEPTLGDGNKEKQMVNKSVRVLKYLQ